MEGQVRVTLDASHLHVPSVQYQDLDFASVSHRVLVFGALAVVPQRRLRIKAGRPLPADHQGIAARDSVQRHSVRFLLGDPTYKSNDVGYCSRMDTEFPSKRTDTFAFRMQFSHFSNFVFVQD